MDMTFMACMYSLHAEGGFTRLHVSSIYSCDSVSSSSVTRIVYYHVIIHVAAALMLYNVVVPISSRMF